jgi:hypothetical protein
MTVICHFHGTPAHSAILVMTVWFEAGLQFQHDHPEEPMYSRTNYII